VLKLKGVELLLRDLLPSQRRQLPLLHLLTQRQVFFFLWFIVLVNVGYLNFVLDMNLF
jgi:hypothetical protein